MDDSHATSGVIEAVRQARAEALRRWMSVLCRGVMSLFGTTAWDRRSWRRE